MPVMSLSSGPLWLNKQMSLVLAVSEVIAANPHPRFITMIYVDVHVQFCDASLNDL